MIVSQQHKPAASCSALWDRQCHTSYIDQPSEMATFMGMEANPPADPALNPAPANLHSMLSQLPSTHSPTVIIIWDFKPALHGLSSTWKGNIISNIFSEINFPLIQRCGLCKLFMGEWVVWKRMCQRFDTGFFFFAKRKKKTPASFIYCVALSEEEQGASKCRNLI